MDTETIREKIERYKIKADLFLKNNLKAFIIDIQDNYYFCNVIKVNEDSINIKNFNGRREDIEEEIYFVDIIKFVGYKDLEDLNNEKR